MLKEVASHPYVFLQLPSSKGILGALSSVLKKHQIGVFCSVESSLEV